MDFIQLIIILFALFAVSRTFMRLRSEEITVNEALFWGIIWIMVIALALLKNYLSFLSRFSNIERPVDIIIYSSIILLFYLVFRLLVKIENIEQEITKIVRYNTLKEKKKK